MKIKVWSRYPIDETFVWIQIIMQLTFKCAKTWFLVLFFCKTLSLHKIYCTYKGFIYRVSAPHFYLHFAPMIVLLGDVGQKLLQMAHNPNFQTLATPPFWYLWPKIFAKLDICSLDIPLSKDHLTLKLENHLGQISVCLSLCQNGLSHRLGPALTIIHYSIDHKVSLTFARKQLRPRNTSMHYQALSIAKRWIDLMSSAPLPRNIKTPL